MRKRRSKRKRILLRRRAGILLLALLLAILVVKLPLSGKQELEPRSFGRAPHITRRLSAEDARRGDLILVNDAHEYDFSGAKKMVHIAARKNSAYQVKDGELSLRADTVRQFNRLFRAFRAETGLSDVTIISAYRDYEYQQRVLDEYAETYGYDGALNWVARPGFSISP